MREIKIFLTNKGFEKCYLHYEIKLNEYFLFINTKKYNRELKKIIKKAKKLIYRDENIVRSTRLIFKPLGYQKAVDYYDSI